MIGTSLLVLSLVNLTSNRRPADPRQNPPKHIAPPARPLPKNIIKLGKGGSSTQDHLEGCLEASIQRGYEDLRTRPALRLTLTHTTGDAVQPQRTSVIAFWYQATPTDPARFELRETDISNWQPRLIRRIVANCGEFGVYDATENTYSVSRYRTSCDSSSGLTRNLTDLQDPAIKPIVKLLDQVFGDDFPVFTPWLPGAYPEGTETYVTFGRGGGQLAASQISFGLFPLKSIVGVEKSAAQVNPCITRWTLIIEHVPFGPGVGGYDFTFTPPSDARRVD